MAGGGARLGAGAGRRGRVGASSGEVEPLAGDLSPVLHAEERDPGVAGDVVHRLAVGVSALHVEGVVAGGHLLGDADVTRQVGGEEWEGCHAVPIRRPADPVIGARGEDGETDPGLGMRTAGVVVLAIPPLGAGVLLDREGAVFARAGVTAGIAARRDEVPLAGDEGVRRQIGKRDA